ncbi:Multidrug and toxin extrusion protein [Fasciola hepatica]|uniref:Multidrug and toxin extrusion protein n=1 Tax=Fasciola hepatica TaxID=6192 RepID=A0A4E0RTH0_FASHE|nr:Multidrug and toxin extrusion protein [Fasciola hepatica]
MTSVDDLHSERWPLVESNDRDGNLIEIPPVVGHGCHAKLFPFGFFYEFKMLFRLAVPIALTSLINYAFGPVSVIFCGHLSALDLATVGLAISVFNVTGLAIIMGLLTACDTLFSQVYGSGNLNHMGLNLQRCEYTSLLDLNIPVRNNYTDVLKTI